MLKLAMPSKPGARLKYEAVNRILSISFERDPQEHVDVVLSINRWYMATHRPRYSWLVLAGAVGFGLGIGLLMELYRRYLLPQLLGATGIPTLAMVLFQFLPFVVLIGTLIAGRTTYLERLHRRTYAAQLEEGYFIDTDVYENGIETTAGDVTVWTPWRAVKEVVVANRRIEIIGDAFVAYLPERAFADKAAFHRAGVRLAELRRLSRLEETLGDLNLELAEAA